VSWKGEFVVALGVATDSSFLAVGGRPDLCAAWFYIVAAVILFALVKGFTRQLDHPPP